MRVFVINGRGRSGKDLFIEIFMKEVDNVYNISSIDPIKSIAKYAG